jgi:hypothetical protein
MDIRTWNLSPHLLAGTVGKIDKINARAARRGLAGRYTYRTGETTEQPVFAEGGTDMVFMETPGGAMFVPHRLERGRLVPCEVIGFEVLTELIVEGDAPCLEGWRFLATLTWDAGAFVPRCVPGFDGVITADQVREGVCDHCGTVRQRRDTYLVENAETGVRQQVGSTCIKDFLGHSVSAAMDLHGDSLDEVEELCRAARCEVAWTVRTVVARAVRVIGEYGFVSVEKAEIERREPTGRLVRCALDPGCRADRELEARTRPAEADYQAADVIVAWVMEQDANGNQYLLSLQSVVAAGTVSSRNAGLMASSVAAYNKATQERIEREARPVSQHVGTLKERRMFVLTILREIPIDSDYGVRPLYVMRDPDGNLLKWFASTWQGANTPESPRWEPGVRVTVKATVVGHEEYKGVRQTMINRCVEVAPSVYEEPDTSGQVLISRELAAVAA